MRCKSCAATDEHEPPAAGVERTQPGVAGDGPDAPVGERRVHKVYRYALPVLIVGQIVTVYVWRANPAWWQGLTHAILSM